MGTLISSEETKEKYWKQKKYNQTTKSRQKKRDLFAAGLARHGKVGHVSFYWKACRKHDLTIY